MPNIHFSVPHSLGQAEALNRIKRLIGDVKTRFGDRISDLKEDWTGNNGSFDLTVMGMSVSGSVQVQNEAVTIDAKIPFAAMAFKGKIEAAIRDKARDLLA